MAGNPFRRPEAGASSIPSAPAPALPGRDGAAKLVVETTPVKPKKVVKRVRIQSPVVSPYEPQDNPFDARLDIRNHSDVALSPSPPPPHDAPEDIATALRKSFIDSVAKGASNLNQEALGPVQQDTPQLGPGTGPPTSTAAGQRAPSNPFARTLATMEPSHESASPIPSQTISTTTVDQTVKAPGKPAMDVNSFTRMLLSGAPPASALPPASSPGPAATSGFGISGHATTSQPSDLNPPSSARFESPRSSFESSRSEDGAGTEIDDRSSLVGQPSTKSANPPPPPAHHKGKLLSKKVPQTVSFDDFEADLASSTSQFPPAQTFDSQSTRPLVAPRSPSDLNKPLPAPPAPIGIIRESDSGRPSTDDALPSDAVADAALQSSKVRPPPPSTRRSSSIRPDGLSDRRRSNSSLSLRSAPNDSNGAPRSATSVSPANRPPPPPPSRKHGHNAGVESLHSVPPDISLQTSTNSKAPPPPPSRNALRSGAPGFSRTPSAQSTTSMGSRPTPSPSQSFAAGPPPPPPRRGEHRSSFDGGISGPGARRMSNGSQRSSLELRRPSVGGSSKGRAPSISSLQHVPETETGAEQETETLPSSKQPDILADLSAFQAEIDALRAQFGK